MYPGRIIAEKYRILRVLGRGGMGVVTEAERLDTGERCAIKFLREDVESDMQPIARFAREARLASKLQSLHTCRLLGVDECSYGPFIVMELLDGRPLSAVLEPGRPLPWQQAVRIAYEACQALGEAHALGIVHRDIKPGNVFLAWSSQQRVITKVLDFGVAKIPSQIITFGGGPSLTDASLLLGTPAYVAPEQLNNSKQVSARADVWALGILLYEMLAGRLPFNCPFVPKLLVMIARDEPPALATINAGLPAELVQLVHRCIFKDPSLRFAEAHSLGEALLPWLDSEETLLEPLLRAATLRPLRTQFSAPPCADSAEEPLELTVVRKHPDSLGPHTTARMTLPAAKRYSRNIALFAGGGLGGLAGILGLFLLGSPERTATTPFGSAQIETGVLTAPSGDGACTTLSAGPMAANPTLTLDGALIPTNPFVVKQRGDTLDHVLYATANGYLPQERKFRFAEASSITLTLTPTPAVALLPKPAKPAAPTRDPKTATKTARLGTEAKARVTAPSRPIDSENPF